MTHLSRSAQRTLPFPCGHKEASPLAGHTDSAGGSRWHRRAVGTGDAPVLNLILPARQNRPWSVGRGLLGPKSLVPPQARHQAACPEGGGLHTQAPTFISPWPSPPSDSLCEAFRKLL